MNSDEKHRCISELHRVKHSLGSVYRVLREERPESIVSSGEGGSALRGCLDEALGGIEDAEGDIELALNAVQSIPEEDEDNS
jgi:hypothetical protein